MSLIKSKGFDFIKNAYPLYLFRRVKFERSELIYFNLDYGFNYILKQAIVRYQEFDSLNKKLTCKAKMTKSVYSRTLQNEAYPVGLVTSPAGDGSYTASPAPVDNNAFGVGAKATPIKSTMALNEVYNYSENIETELIWDSKPNEAAYVDLLLIGYQVPENVDSIWGS